MRLKLTVLLASLMGPVAFLGLAALGWGNLVDFLAHPARIALCVVSLGLGIVAGFSAGNLSSGVREDRSNRWVIAAFTVIGIAAGYLPAYTDRREIWTIDGDAVRWLGVALFSLVGVLR